MKKFYPLLSYNTKYFGFASIVLALVLIFYSLFFTKINEDISLWLLCFGLFCFGYRKEKDEEEESNRYFQYRYHSFRISFALTTVIILISSSSFIFEKTSIKINCLYALLFISLCYNIIYYILKKDTLINPLRV